MRLEHTLLTYNSCHYNIVNPLWLMQNELISVFRRRRRSIAVAASDDNDDLPDESSEFGPAAGVQLGVVVFATTATSMFAM